MQNVAGWSSFGWVTMRRQGGGGIPTANLQVFLDGDDTDGSGNSTRTNGVAFNDWLNKGALGGTFSNATGTQQPLFASSLLAGHAGATFDGTDDRLVSSLAASSFTFMHDGTGATIYSVVRTAVSGVRTICATGTGGTTTVSMGHRINTGFAASYFMSDGVALRLSANGAAASVSNNLFDVQSSRLRSSLSPHLSIDVNGVSVATADSAAFSASAPAATLHVGTNSAGVFPLAGNLLLLLVYNVAHDDATMDAIKAALDARFGVVFPA